MLDKFLERRENHHRFLTFSDRDILTCIIIVRLRAMTVHRNVANATLRIEYGASRGSGFHFLTPDIVVTNQHVLPNLQTGQGGAVGVTESGQRLNLTLLESSPATDQDFAVLKVQGAVPAGRHALLPKVVSPFERGTPVLFGGFPHGIPHLLVQAAIVSGLVSDRVFYLDGSVNGGNSGGPIVDPSDGCVVGVVTQRRFLGAQDLGQLRAAAEQLRNHCQAIAGRGSVQIMGIDFGSFSQMQAEAMLLIREVLEANANTGIGIGFAIDFALAACKSHGITNAA